MWFKTNTIIWFIVIIWRKSRLQAKSAGEKLTRLRRKHCCGHEHKLREKKRSLISGRVAWKWCIQIHGERYIRTLTLSGRIPWACGIHNQWLNPLCLPRKQTLGSSVARMSIWTYPWIPKTSNNYDDDYSYDSCWFEDCEMSRANV